MTVETSPNTFGNGNVPTATKPKDSPPAEAQSILMTIFLTLYDVVVFLAVSIGYICQVSILTSFFHLR